MGWRDTVNLLENLLMEVTKSATMEFPNMPARHNLPNSLSADQG
jgi:hypothetical protein